MAGKTKRERQREELSEALNDFLAEGYQKQEAVDRLAETLLDIIQDPPPKKVKGGNPMTATKVYEAWAEAVYHRHGFRPDRDPVIAASCLALVKRVGMEVAPRLAAFYVAQNDAFYVQSQHDLRFCVRDYHRLKGRMETGNVVTERTARKNEALAATAAASRSYLGRKYGGKTDA